MAYDVIVLGGGPAGAIAAMYLKRSGKTVLLVDKARFPRDKVCGDAQGRKAARIMRELGICEEYEKLPGQKIYGITLSSPNGTQVHLDVAQRSEPAPGYVHTRMVFDDFLFQCAKERVETRAFNATELIVEKDFVKGVIGTNERGEKEEIRANLVLAADGANSMVAIKTGLNKNPDDHHIVALRAYYKNVKGMTDRIELHLIKTLLPGYFWIFPLPDGEANVGLGMVKRDMQKKKIDLRKAIIKEIEENPLFRERFKDAELVGPIVGWNLPIASYHRKCYGNGFMLLGDAASLIDPLSGEGVGNAMISGKLAAQIAAEALESRDYSENFLQKYDKMLWDEIGDEIKTSYRVQRLGKRFPHLIDKLMVKATQDEEFRKRVEKLLPYTGGRKEIGSAEFIKELAAA